MYKRQLLEVDFHADDVDRDGPLLAGHIRRDLDGILLRDDDGLRAGILGLLEDVRHLGHRVVVMVRIAQALDDHRTEVGKRLLEGGGVADGRDGHDALAAHLRDVDALARDRCV